MLRRFATTRPAWSPGSAVAGKDTSTMSTGSHTLHDGWRHLAACKGPEADLFFPPAQPERKEDRLVRERAAKLICAGCPVRVQCLEYALSVREPYGIWGGLNEYERRRLGGRRAG
jgi:WhiB family redox-sensing transcriptional regulator